MSVHTFHRKVLAIHLSCTGRTAEDFHTSDSSGPTVHNLPAGNEQPSAKKLYSLFNLFVRFKLLKLYPTFPIQNITVKNYKMMHTCSVTGWTVFAISGDSLPQ